MGPGEVQVWRFELDRGAWAEALTEEERERAALFRTEELRRRYVAAHAGLHEALEACGAGRVTRFARGEHGKPYLAGSRLRFSLSHSGEVALVAVALDVEVGVDVERVRENVEGAALARRFLPAEEAAAVEREPSSFFRYWTRREAYVKALGVGIRGLGMAIAAGYSITDMDAGEGYAAAVAVSAGGYAIRRAGLGG
jgi:4'-phosphopantetheinyl transferase